MYRMITGAVILDKHEVEELTKFLEEFNRVGMIQDLKQQAQSFLNRLTKRLNA